MRAKHDNFHYKFIDLFAGLGGFHFALEGIGCECVFASELKEDLRKLYHINFPQLPLDRIKGDITKIAPQDIPPHDILCAGFPCQPFSQAGKQMGFSDKGRGNLFYNIRDIIAYHRPRYVMLENVANLLKHDDGNTWNVIYNTLHNELRYEVREAILSPHQFKIPQHRKRIYIVCENMDYGHLENFVFPPVPSNPTCAINSIINKDDTDYIHLKAETRHQIDVWQDFIDQIVKSGEDIPRFPIWAMEFGANYDYEDLAPAFQPEEELRGKRGHLGHPVKGNSKEELLNCLPVYARTAKAKTFPKWKISYIKQNREFYEKNKAWIKVWLKKAGKFNNSHLKLEWNCGNVTPTLNDKIIQFRASGIRVKLPTFSPALNLVGTQIPIFPWVKLPPDSICEGEPDHGRYMTRNEAAALQGMAGVNGTPDIKWGDDTFQLSMPRSFEALGNAVNVTIVKHIAKYLLDHE